MKKPLYAAIVLAALSAPAQADWSFNPYVGVDYQLTRLSYADDIDGGHDNFSGANIHVGNRFNDHFGLELGYFRTTEKSSSGIVAATPYTLKGRLQGVSFDALGYVPVTADRSLELIGTAGLAYTHGKLDMNVGGTPFSDTDNAFGFRIGGGAQYNITSNFNVRGLVRFQTVNLDAAGTDVTDNAWALSLGANYQF